MDDLYTVVFVVIGSACFTAWLVRRWRLRVLPWYGIFAEERALATGVMLMRCGTTRVVLKLCSAREASACKRLQRKGASHAHLIKVLRVYDSDAPTRALMTYGGSDLYDVIDAGHVAAAPARVLAWLADVSDAAHHLHTRIKCAHCDIKPENVFVSDNGTARLGDFGGLTKIAERVSQVTPGYFNQHFVALPGSDVFSIVITCIVCVFRATPDGFQTHTHEGRAHFLQFCAGVAAFGYAYVLEAWPHNLHVALGALNARARRQPGAGAPAARSLTPAAWAAQRLRPELIERWLLSRDAQELALHLITHARSCDVSSPGTDASIARLARMTARK